MGAAEALPDPVLRLEDEVAGPEPADDVAEIDRLGRGGLAGPLRRELAPHDPVAEHLLELQELLPMVRAALPGEERESGPAHVLLRRIG